MRRSVAPIAQQPVLDSRLEVAVGRRAEVAGRRRRRRLRCLLRKSGEREARIGVRHDSDQLRAERESHRLQLERGIGAVDQQTNQLRAGHDRQLLAVGAVDQLLAKGDEVRVRGSSLTGCTHELPAKKHATVCARGVRHERVGGSIL